MREKSWRLTRRERGLTAREEVLGMVGAWADIVRKERMMMRNLVVSLFDNIVKRVVLVDEKCCRSERRSVLEWSKLDVRGVPL
jgi:hypothetical protein